MQPLPSIGADDVLAATLKPLGPWPPAGTATSGDPHAFGLEFSNDEHAETGIWECTPGSFPSRRQGTAELMHFVAGDATLTDDAGGSHTLGPGSVIFLPDGWSGAWEIRQTVRKTYVTIKTVQA